MSESAQVWINGRIVPAAEARVSVFDHGLLYGDGVFEGIRFYNRQPFRLRAHLQRLRHSAAAIRLKVPYDESALSTAVAATVDAFTESDGYVRLLITRGEGPLGIDPATCRQPNVIVITDRMALVSETQRQQGIRLAVAATRRLPVDGLDPRIKSLNYLNHILARMEASNAGAQEAVLLNTAGHVTEGSADNLFVVRSGVLMTPPTSDGALDGITRGIVLDLAAEANMPARETTLTPYDLYTAEECFLTGTGAELIPVRKVDQRPLQSCPGPVFTDLQRRFQNLVAAETAAGGDE